MRLLIDSLVALMLAGVLAGIVMASRESESMEARIHETSASVWRIQQEVMLQTALNRDGAVTLPPHTIDPDWFNGDLPRNPLLEDEGRPWLEIADGAELSLQHPVDKVSLDRRAARFWYNPANGAVRARVPLLMSDAESLDLYNRVNGTDLTDLYGQER